MELMQYVKLGWRVLGKDDEAWWRAPRQISGGSTHGHAGFMIPRNIVKEGFRKHLAPICS